MRRRLTIMALLLSLAVPTFADESPRHQPSLRDRAVKIVKMVLGLLEGGDMSWPKP
jgi:hypothetical protein